MPPAPSLLRKEGESAGADLVKSNLCHVCYGTNYKLAPARIVTLARICDPCHIYLWPNTGCKKVDFHPTTPQGGLIMYWPFNKSPGCNDSYWMEPSDFPLFAKQRGGLKGVSWSILPAICPERRYRQTLPAENISHCIIRK